MILHICVKICLYNRPHLVVFGNATRVNFLLVSIQYFLYILIVQSKHGSCSISTVIPISIFIIDLLMSFGAVPMHQ